MTDEASKHASLKEKAIHELRLFVIITVYLVLLLGSFALYRRLVLDEIGVGYLTYGFKLVEALIIAKVILIGEALGLGKSSEKHRLAVAVVVKSILFAIFIAVFNVLEQAVEAHFHGVAWGPALLSFTDKGRDEMIARSLVMLIALVPFFAFLELGRALGPGKLQALFFSRPTNP